MTFVFGALAFLTLGTGQAIAIPSPELVVGSFVSISQLFALASAVLGGGAAYATVRAGRNGSTAMSRGLLYISAVMLVVLVASISINIYQYVTASNARQERLEATLSRPVQRPAGRATDPAFKEVSYGEQLRHPRGVTTSNLERLLEAKARGDHPQTFLLDIREQAETEIGTMAGAFKARSPDIKTSGIDFTNKIAILIDDDGNRSYEACIALAGLGIDCRFLVGGLEKWLVEQRPLAGAEGAHAGRPSGCAGAPQSGRPARHSAGSRSHQGQRSDPRRSASSG